MGEIVAQHIEHKLPVQIDRKLNLGGTLLAHQALLTKEIDLYPEYSGTALMNVLKQSPMTDPGIVLDRVRTEYAQNMRLTWLDPFGFDNTFAMVVRGADARARHLETLSDAANDPKGFTLGSGYEFIQRPDGFATLSVAYPIHWAAPPKTMDLGLLYTALHKGNVSMVAGNVTDGVLASLDAKILADDKHAFPPYQACLVVRTDVLDGTPNLRAVLGQLSGKISNEGMRKMNFEVDSKHRPVTEVAREFLQQNGLN